MSESGFYVYVTNGAKKISVLRLSPETGELTKLQEVVVHGDEIPEGVKAGSDMPLAVTPDRRFLYAANRTAPYTIHSFAIDRANGMLTPFGESPTIESAPYISTDRTGRFLFGAFNPATRGGPGGYVSVSAISEHGYALAPHQVICTPPKTHSILPDPSNRFVFVPSCDGDMVVRFAFDLATGLLDRDGLSPVVVRPKSGPRHFRFHPNNRFMYLLNEYDAALYVYSYDARNGALSSELQTASARPPDFDKDANQRASDLHFTPDGKWLYASARNSSTMAVFRVDALSCLLTPAGHYPVPKEPRGFNIDPFGRYLLAAGKLANRVASYRIDSDTGALTRVAEVPLEAPNWVEIVRLP